MDEVFASLKNSQLCGVRTSAQIFLGTRSVWIRTEPLLQFVATALSLEFPRSFPGPWDSTPAPEGCLRKKASATRLVMNL